MPRWEEYCEAAAAMEAMLERLALDMPCSPAAAMPGNMDDMAMAECCCCCCCCWRSEDMIVMARGEERR